MKYTCVCYEYNSNLSTTVIIHLVLMMEVMYVLFMSYSEEVYSPEELLGMIFNSSRQFAEDYAGNITHLAVLSDCDPSTVVCDDCSIRVFDCFIIELTSLFEYFDSIDFIVVPVWYRY